MHPVTLLCRSAAFISILTIVACGGGGGGGSSTPAPAPTPTPAPTPAQPSFSYDTIVSPPENKLWDAISYGKVRLSNNAPFAEYSIDLLASITERSAGADFSLAGETTDGTTISYDWSVTESNIAVAVPLFDESGNVQAGLIGQSFANAESLIALYAPDWLATVGVEYVNFASIQIVSTTGTGRVDTFPLIYGDLTETADVPTTGSEVFSMAANSIFQYWEADGSTILILGTGSATLTIDYAAKSVVGSIQFARFYDYGLFLAGGSDYSQILSFPAQSFDLVGGTLTGGLFAGELRGTTAVSQGIIGGAGGLTGALFGPNAADIGASILLLKSDEDTATTNYWDSAGSLIGS